MDNLIIKKTKYRISFYKSIEWMTGALLVTGFVALYTASSEPLLRLIFGNRPVLFGLIILELVAVESLATMVYRMSASTATAIFVGLTAYDTKRSRT